MTIPSSSPPFLSPPSLSLLPLLSSLHPFSLFLRLRQLSQDTGTSDDVLKNIATLMTNIFEAGGTNEGKKTALQSGVLDLTIKLLQSRDPVPVSDDMRRHCRHNSRLKTGG